MKKAKLDGVKGTIRMLEGLFEVGLLAIIYYVIWRRGYDPGVFPFYYGYGKYVLSGIYALLTGVLFHNLDGFKFGYLKFSDVSISQLLAVVITNFITYWQLCLIANKVISPVPVIALTVIDVGIVFFCTSLYNNIYHHLYHSKNMVMIYGRENAVVLKFKMESRKDKYQINRLISAEKDLDYICEEISKYEAVIINDVEAGIRNEILKFCYKNKLRAYVTPKLSDIIVRGGTDINLFDTPLLLVRGKGLTSTERIMKRVFDLVLCLIAMIPALPVMLIVALAIKLEDGGPVFYKQKRATLGGEVFEILKFRSMIVDAEKPGQSIPATDKDPRITKVGNIIRATRVDELPQLLNIIKGDMSIVGPRPERVEHVEEYEKLIPEFGFRLKVKGGLTGYAQIYGKYNTTPYDKLRLDLMYIENYSLLTDVKLILMTIRIILKKESTEGFDKVDELERLKEEELRRAEEEN